MVFQFGPFECVKRTFQVFGPMSATPKSGGDPVNGVNLYGTYRDTRCPMQTLVVSENNGRWPCGEMCLCWYCYGCPMSNTCLCKAKEDNVWTNNQCFCLSTDGTDVYTQCMLCASKMEKLDGPALYASATAAPETVTINRE